MTTMSLGMRAGTSNCFVGPRSSCADACVEADALSFRTHSWLIASQQTGERGVIVRRRQLFFGRRHSTSSMISRLGHEK